MNAPRVYSLAEAADLPQPEPLIEGLLFTNGYSALVGPSGVGKSFVALALAISVASGTPFFGRKTRRGAVVYVAPEGFTTFHTRALAAMRAAEISDLQNLFLVPDAVYLHDAASIVGLVGALKERIQEPIALVCFDTLAKCSAGMDENSNSDRELTNTGLDHIRKETGAHTLVIHHTGWNEMRERGATALRANVDTLLLLKSDEDCILLTAEKQRDRESGSTMRLALMPFGDSQIVTEPDAGMGSERLPDAHLKALQVLDGIALSDGIACSAWLSSSQLKPSSFYRARKALVARGYVMALGRSKYVVSPEGRALLPASTALPNHFHGSGHHSTSTTPTPFRVGVGGSSASSSRVELGDAWEPASEGAA